jgi:hypothetical protein
LPKAVTYHFHKQLHIVLGNSASEKELFKQELVELRSQLETERVSREKTELPAWSEPRCLPVAALLWLRGLLLFGRADRLNPFHFTMDVICKH